MEQNQIITIDTADLSIGLSTIEQNKLIEMLAKCREARSYRGLPPLQGIFVRLEDPAFNDVMEAYSKHHQNADPSQLPDE